MRIALSNASSAWGGVHLVTEVLARGLQARGHEVIVLGRPGSMLEERMREVAPFEPVLGGMDLHPATLLRAFRTLRRHRSQVALTLVKKDVRLTGPAAWAAGVPVVVRHANDQPLGRGPYARWLYGAVPVHHVTNAEATRRTVLASAPWLRPERVTVIRNGLRLEDYAVAPADLGLPADAVAIGYVGSFEPRKGLLDLAAAWPRVAAAHPAAHLVMVGKGSQDALLRERLAAAPRVHFCGYRKDVAAVMRALDALVLPSYVEGAPNVVQQAMAAEVPVVATAVSGTPELLADGIEGLLVPPRDPERLAAALGRLAGDAALRRRMGANGLRRAAEHFTLDGMIDAYEALFRRVAEAGR